MSVNGDKHASGTQMVAREALGVFVQKDNPLGAASYEEVVKLFCTSHLTGSLHGFDRLNRQASDLGLWSRTPARRLIMGRLLENRESKRNLLPRRVLQHERGPARPFGRTVAFFSRRM
jgi:hypothetical protein